MGTNYQEEFMPKINSLIKDAQYSDIRISVVFGIAYFIMNQVVQNPIKWYYPFVAALAFFVILAFCRAAGDLKKRHHVNDIPEELKKHIRSWMQSYEIFNDNPHKAIYIAESYKNIAYIIDESDTEIIVRELNNFIESMEHEMEERIQND